MSPSDRLQSADKDVHSYEQLTGSYQPIYQYQGSASHPFMMPTVCSFSPRDFEQYHGLPFDMLPPTYPSQPDFISADTESGNDFYISGPSDDNDYFHTSTRRNPSADQSSYRPQNDTVALQGTLEPHMIFRHAMPLQYEESLPCFSCDPATSFYQPEDFSSDAAMEPYNTMTHKDRFFPYESRFSPIDSEASLNTPISKYTEDEEEAPIMDKPYARLIYEALMQAPGHSMMLRDIYDWFAINTNKPRESGSNGWQNSIRHNLSMNQAFENDKSDASTRGHPRKANSIWVLTEHAVKHGVQSTTRYRKSGTAKKGSGYRAAVTERQKSGAKGGKAARRAALLRKHEEHSRTNSPSESKFAYNITSARWLDTDPSTSPSDQISTPRYCPATPVDEYGAVHSYDLSQISYSMEPQVQVKQEVSLSEDAHDLRYVSDALTQNFPGLHHGHDSLSVMFT